MSDIIEAVYLTAGGACYALDVFSKLLWQTGDLQISRGGPIPAVKPGAHKVWVAAGEDLLTLDIYNGNVIRKVSFGGLIAYTGCHGPNLIVGINDGRTFAIDTETEAIRWSTQLETLVDRVVETMDVLLILQPAAPSVAKAFGAYSGQLLWQTPYSSIVASADNGIFYLQKLPQQVEARATDGSVIWYATVSNYNFATVLVVGETVYATTDEKMLYAFLASSGAMKWSTDIPGYPGPWLLQYSSDPPASSDKVVVGFDGSGPSMPPGLAAYEAATGSEEWVVSLPGTDVYGLSPVAPAMRFFSGWVATSRSDHGIVYKYKTDGQPLWPPWSPGGSGVPVDGLAYLPLDSI